MEASRECAPPDGPDLASHISMPQPTSAYGSARLAPAPACCQMNNFAPLNSLGLSCDKGQLACLNRDTGEAIEVLALPLTESQGFMDDPSIAKSAGLLFGLMWLRNRVL